MVVSRCPRKCASKTLRRGSKTPKRKSTSIKRRDSKTLKRKSTSVKRRVKGSVRRKSKSKKSVKRKSKSGKRRVRKSVKRSRSRSKSAGDEKSVFVFYNTTRDGETWEYKNLPEGWWFVGGGSTRPIKGKISESNVKALLYNFNTAVYGREEQFLGPRHSRRQMQKYLRSFFKKLQKKGIVSKFIVGDKYGEAEF